jgi:hypothetical protein
MKNLNLNTILLVGIAVLMTLQLKSCFEPARVDRKLIEAQIKQEQYEKELPEIRKELDYIYAKYDSLLLSSLQRENNIEQRKTPLRYAIKQVPVIVSNLDREQLRIALTSY